MSYVAHDESAFVPPAEVEEAELYHPKTFVGKYIWSQDGIVNLRSRHARKADGR